ncbi:MAG: hypothetical protein IJV62_00460, partial [Eggerthellaceae bacterium]|nr:hypothetical protein [Eggerthellaceae bacterium]
MHEVVSHYDAFCKKENLDAMYLYVNKNNELGMRAYKGTGFENKGSYVSEIGAGFVVDDWEFERTCCVE